MKAEGRRRKILFLKAFYKFVMVSLFTPFCTSGLEKGTGNGQQGNF
jgi:hypothetical protein